MVLLILGLLLLLILIGMPVAFALGVTSLLYLVIEGYSLSMVAQSIVRGINSFTMLAIPFFFLAGELMNSSGITDRIIRMAKVLVGHFKGGLAQVNILASVLFSGISGSATADTAALGSTLIPAMKKEGYDKDFATAITVASSLIGPIIPPSITMVIYGIVAQQPIGPLLIAGIVPGVIFAIGLMIYTYFYSKKMNYPSEPKADFKEAKSAFGNGIVALMMPVIIVGGIFSGFFTPTESAAIAVLYGVLIGFFYYKNLTPKNFFSILTRVSLTSFNTLFILATATVFSWVITRARVPNMLIDSMYSISTNPTVLLGLMVLFLLIIGLFMLPSQALIVLAPIFVPAAIEIGVDPIHFGVVMVVTLLAGAATPPVGVVLYVASDIANLEFLKLVKAMVPLYIPILVTIILLTFFPSISLFLPNLLFK